MLDLQTAEFTRKFQLAPLYQKFSLVTITEIPPGTEVKTILRDGAVETFNVADENQHFLVTNMGGERYLISREKVKARYTHLTGDEYLAMGRVRAFPNPTGADVTIMAPWGNEQHGAPDCYLACFYDPHYEDGVGPDRYLIGHAEFRDTYRLVV